MGIETAAAPATVRRPESELLHGDAIVDDYRWLEHGDDPEVAAWTAAQNAHTAAYLAQVPEREAIRARLAELLRIGTITAPVLAGARLLYQRREGEQNQPVLLVRDAPDGPDRVAVDVNALDPAGTTALDWYYPSHDGRLLAYGLSTDGSELSTLHLLDLDTLAPLPDTIPHTRAASVAWAPDSRSFHYTRYPEPGTVPAGEERYHRAVFLHRLGDDWRDDARVFTPDEKEHWPGVARSADGRWLLISVSRGFDRNDLYLQDLARGGPLVPVAKDEAAMFDGEVAHGTLYLRTNLDAPTWRLCAADPERPAREHWRELVPARADAVLDGVAVTRHALVLSYLERATSRLRVADLEGRHATELALPGLGSVYGLGTDETKREVYVAFTSFSVPPSVYVLPDAQPALAPAAHDSHVPHVPHAHDATTTPAPRLTLWQRVTADIDPDRFTADQVTYASADGTPVTMFIVAPRDCPRDGSRPCWLTGYGGFNIALTPVFSRAQLLWLERGGVVAIPNLRGGGEYGEAWHQAGMLAHKQRTFDDCIAAAEYLIREGWTRAERLALQGGSNGGLLAGAVLTQRPELFGAVVIQVPLLDMLRYHRFLIARLWIPEYGSPEDPVQYRWLRAYSPYHHVRDGAHYPAVLLATAASDTRVDPCHARKMAARLQAANASGRPILLRLEAQAGHGAGKPIAKLLDELADSWSFIVQETRGAD